MPPGNWSYSALNSQNSIQSLAVGATLTDTLTVTSKDGTTRDVVVTITGINDAPTVAKPVPEPGRHRKCAFCVHVRPEHLQ